MGEGKGGPCVQCRAPGLGNVGEVGGGENELAAVVVARACLPLESHHPVRSATLAAHNALCLSVSSLDRLANSVVGATLAQVRKRASAWPVFSGHFGSREARRVREDEIDCASKNVLN